MERIGYGEPYLLTEKEELKLINEINIELDEYEKNIKSNNPIDIHCEIIISGFKNCMKLMKLYSKKEGINNDMKFNASIFYGIQIPQKLRRNFLIMQRIRGKLIHEFITETEIKNFLTNLEIFLKGFEDFYSEKYNIQTPLNINSLCNSIKSIIENNNFDETKKLPETFQSRLEKNEPFTEEYEKAKINSINHLLKSLEKEIDNLKNTKNDVYNYSILIHGQKISESMIILYVEKNGYELDNKEIMGEYYYSYQARKSRYKIEYQNFMRLLYFCREASILPYNSIKFLITMRRYQNEGIHGTKPTYDIIKTYLKTFNYFLIWFNEFYSQNYSNKNLFEINEISSIIQSLSKDELINDNFIKLDEERKNLETQFKEVNKEIGSIKEKKLDSFTQTKLKMESDGETASKSRDDEIKVDFHYKDLEKELHSLERKLDYIKAKQSELESIKIMKALENLGKSQDILEKKVDEISETTQRIEEKVDMILNTIDIKLDALQSFITNQINTASKEDIERIITNFTNEYIEKISPEYYKNISKKEEYEKEKKKLIYTSLGEDAWNKLSDKSQIFLVTSKVMYNDLIMVEDISDYSGVCILVAKALEVEMFNRFYTDFIKYLKEKHGENYEKYPSSLIHTNRNNVKSIVFEKNFYMGTVVYLLSPKKDKYKKKHQIKHDEKVILEYCKNCIFSDKNEKEIRDTLNEYSNDIETIKDKYRNPSAHRNAIQRINAEECFELVLDYEKLLKKMLDSFNY